MNKAILDYKKWKINEGSELTEANIEKETTTTEKSETEIRPKGSITADGMLTLNIGDETIQVQMHDATGRIQSIKSDFNGFGTMYNYKTKNYNTPPGAWYLKLSEIRNALAKTGWNITAYNNEGKSLNDPSIKQEHFLMVGSPKGYSGPIKGVIGTIGSGPTSDKGGKGHKLVGTADTAWGFFDFVTYATTKTPQDGFKKIRVYKKESDTVVKETKTITDDFEKDSFKLSQSAISKIDGLAADGIKKVKIGTGASQDGPIDELIDPNPAVGRKSKMKREDWDKYLVDMRYKTLKNYLSKKGITVEIHPKGMEGGKYKVYGVFTSNLASDANRKLKVIPTK